MLIRCQIRICWTESGQSDREEPPSAAYQKRLSLDIAELPSLQILCFFAAFFLNLGFQNFLCQSIFYHSLELLIMTGSTVTLASLFLSFFFLFLQMLSHLLTTLQKDTATFTKLRCSKFGAGFKQSSWSEELFFMKKLWPFDHNFLVLESDIQPKP